MKSQLSIKLLLLVFCTATFIYVPAQNQRYVKTGGTGDGLSWETASGDIQLMMNELAETGGEVWVAKGSYVPAHIQGDGTTEEDKAFLMVKDVKLYGGFSGNESLPEQRDWKRNATILSGRLNEDQRAHHTVIAAGETGSACIDGFTIMEGYATRKEGEASYLHVNNEEIDRGYGGGICIRNASPALSNLIITENQAIFGGAVCIARYSSPILSNLIINMNQAGRGGGIYISYYSSPILSNITITDNHAGEGGGICFVGGTLSISNSVISKNTANSEGGGISTRVIKNPLVLTNVVISGNKSEKSGGGIFLYATGITITNGLITENDAPRGGGIMYDYTMSMWPGPAAVRNSIIWGNTGENVGFSEWGSFYPKYRYTLLERENPDEEGNLSGNTNPAFVNAGNGDFHLSEGSPCREAGSAAYFSPDSIPNISHITTDLDGYPRIANGKINLGPYQNSVSGFDGLSSAGKVRIYPNPVSDVLHIESEFPVAGVTICNLQGKPMGQVSGRSILSLEQLPHGVYILLIETARGSVVKKIVKQ